MYFFCIDFGQHINMNKKLPYQWEKYCWSYGFVCVSADLFQLFSIVSIFHPFCALMNLNMLHFYVFFYPSSHHHSKQTLEIWKNYLMSNDDSTLPKHHWYLVLYYWAPCDKNSKIKFLMRDQLICHRNEFFGTIWMK